MNLNLSLLLRYVVFAEWQTVKLSQKVMRDADTAEILY